MEFGDLFLDEHKQIRRAMAVLNVMITKAEEGRLPDRHDVNALLVFLHGFADACHQAKEETILFPAVASAERAAMSVNVDHLLKEHSEDRALIEETQMALLLDKPADFCSSARKLVERVTHHVDEEELVLIPIAEQTLTHKEAADVYSRCREADERMGRRQRHALLDMLDQLDRKYAQEAA